MRENRNSNLVLFAFEDQKARLAEPLNWFPYPALLAIGLATIFFGHLLFNLNPRIRSQAEVLSFDALPAKDGGIWLSLLLDGNHLVVANSTNERFTIPITDVSDDSLDPLVKYLKDEISAIAVDVVLRNKLSPLQTTVTLAVDQRLKYMHLRPIFSALAAAGITNYAFETKMLLSDLSQDHSEIH